MERSTIFLWENQLFLMGKSPFFIGKSPFLMGKSPFFMGKLTISMAMFNSYVTNDQSVAIVQDFQDSRDKPSTKRVLGSTPAPTTTASAGNT